MMKLYTDLPHTRSVFVHSDDYLYKMDH